MALVLAQTLQQAIAAHREGRLSDAEQLYRAILLEHPNNPVASHNLGLLSLMVGAAHEAVGFFEAAVRSDASQLQFWTSYIDSLLGVNRLAQASDAVRQMRRVGFQGQSIELLEGRVMERFSAALINQLVIAFSNGNHGDFRRLATELIEHFPSLYVGWKALGVAELRSGNPTEALGNLRRAEKLNSSDAEILKYIADAQRSLGLVQDSEASYISAISMRPDFAEAHHALGTLLASSGRFSEAEEFYRRSIVFKPSFVAAYMGLGVALESLNRPREAKYYFSEATMLAPRDSRTHYNFARFLQIQDDLDGAERAYRRALEYDPSDIQTLGPVTK